MHESRTNGKKTLFWRSYLSVSCFCKLNIYHIKFCYLARSGSGVWELMVIQIYLDPDKNIDVD